MSIVYTMIDKTDSQHNVRAFLWHAVFLSLAVTFTEVNTVIPALILQIGGNSFHVGIVSVIMIGIPLISKMLFTSYLSGKRVKRPYMLIGINARIVALLLIAVTLYHYRSFSFGVLLVMIYLELLLFTLSGAFAGLPYIHIAGSSIDLPMRRTFFTTKGLIASIGMFVSLIIAQGILRVTDYPVSYVLLFALAAGCLFIASLGFWAIREVPVAQPVSFGYIESLRMIPSVLRENRTLRNYIWYSNIMSLGMALIPFFIAYAQDRFYLDAAVLSNILLIQIAGMIIASFFWPKIVAAGGFKRVLHIRTILSVLLPVIAVVIGLTGSLYLYLPVFFLIGWSVSARTVSEDAVLVELSDDTTRVLYSGIVGTLNISIIIFPLIIGTLIELIGFIPVFATVSGISIIAFPLVHRMICPVDTRVS
jgi:hypothetical protein